MSRTLPPAGALALLLGLNLLNYADRSVLSALEAKIEPDVLGVGDPDAKAKMGSLVFAFLVTYMLLAPVFGVLADRWRRWWIVGLGVLGAALASFGTGMATTFGFLFVMRALVGVSEAAYGPAAPTIIADLFPVERRGGALAWFYLAIPVGSALGYVYGGAMAGWVGWRWGFYGLLFPGLVLGAICLFLKDPARGGANGGAAEARGASTVGGAGPAARKPESRWALYRGLMRTPSFVWNCAGQTGMTFAIGGISFFMPRFVALRLSASGDGAVTSDLLAKVNLTFGGITAMVGVGATLAGGYLADRLRRKYGGAYLSMSGWAMILAFPVFLGVLVLPFPLAWVALGACVFLVFLNTGPSNTAIANVTSPAVRASAFALNILVIHALGDAISPFLIGAVADAREKSGAMEADALRWGFALVGVAMLVAGVCWLVGARYVVADTERVERASG